MGIMFLRVTNRHKDGKDHRYYSVVENRRVRGGKHVQKTVLYLGEINDTQKAAWTKTIDTIDERGHRQVALFPEDRDIPEGVEELGVQVRLKDHQARQGSATVARAAATRAAATATTRDLTEAVRRLVW